MIKKTITIMSLILMVSLVQAIYEGPNIINSGLDELISWQIINNDTWINATQISNTSIQVTIPELTTNLSFGVIFKGYKNEEPQVVYVNSGGGSGGGSHTVYKNNTIYRNVTQYVDKIKEVEKIVYKDNNDSIKTITIPKTPSNSKGLSPFWIVVGVSVILTLIFFVVKYFFFGKSSEAGGIV